MNDGEVKVSDEVTLYYTTQCTSAVNGDGNRECDAMKIAEGIISKVLNEHNSEVTITDDDQFSKGVRVIRKDKFTKKVQGVSKAHQLMGARPSGMNWPT